MTDKPAASGARWAGGLILLQSVIYGFGDTVAKTAYKYASVYPVMVIRYFLALAILFALFGKRIAAGLRASRVRDWLLPSLCMGAAFIMGNIAVQLTAATNAAFLRSLSTVLTPILALVVFHKGYSWRHIPIQIAVLAGLYLLCAQGGLSGFGPGEVCALTQALLLAGSLVFGQRSLTKVDPVTLTTMMTAASAVMSVGCMLTIGGGWDLPVSMPLLWGCILYLTVGCTIAGYLLQNTALKYIPSRTAALLQCTAPVMTALFSRLVLGEKLTAAGVAGAAVILLCVAAETMIKDREA